MHIFIQIYIKSSNNANIPPCVYSIIMRENHEELIASHIIFCYVLPHSYFKTLHGKLNNYAKILRVIWGNYCIKRHKTRTLRYLVRNVQIIKILQYKFWRLRSLYGTQISKYKTRIDVLSIYSKHPISHLPIFDLE